MPRRPRSGRRPPTDNQVTTNQNVTRVLPTLQPERDKKSRRPEEEKHEHDLQFKVATLNL